MNTSANTLLARRREILSLRVDERASALLDDPRVGELVRALPGPDLYLTIVTADAEQAVQVLSHASVPQFQIFLDLDGWAHGRLDLERWCAWLEQASRAAPQLLLQWLKKSDEEMVVFLLSSVLQIYKLDPSCPEDCWPPERPTATLDGRYYFEAKPGVSDGAFQAVLQALSHLRSQRSATYEALLEQVIWMIPNETEEAAYQNRAARLAACGFPELDESLEVWAADKEARPGQRRAMADKVPQTAPSAMNVPRQRAPSWLGRALATLSKTMNEVDPETRDRVLDEVTHIGSRYAVTALTHLGDPQTHAAGLRTALSHLNLGLEVLEAEADGKSPSALLTHLCVLDITRAGLGAVYQRTRRARELLERGWLARVHRGLARLDAVLEAPLGGLLSPHPALSTPDEDDERPFRDRNDLVWIDATLETTEAMGRFIEHRLGGGRAEIPEIEALEAAGTDLTEIDLRWSTVILTCLARAVAGKQVRPLPLTAAEWPRIVPLLVDRSIPPTPSRAWEKAVAAYELEPARDLLAQRMLEEFGDEEMPQFDPRFVRSLLLVGG